jgi:Holliday junction resolvase RusA-like endonuclease
MPGHETTPRVILSPVLKSWRASCLVELLVQRIPRARIAAPVALEFDAVPPHDHRVRDLDNILKPLLDLLVLGDVLDDDSFVDSIAITRSPPNGKGWVTIRVVRSIRNGR